MYLEDISTEFEDEISCRARFYLNSTQMQMAASGALRIFSAYSGQDEVLKVYLCKENEVYQVKAAMLKVNVGGNWEETDWYTLEHGEDVPDDWSAVELHWVSSYWEGAMDLWLDGLEKEEITGKDTHNFASTPCAWGPLTQAAM